MFPRFKMVSAIMTNLPTFTLALTTVLILVDAAIGYHLAPYLVRKGDADAEVTDGAVRGVRRLLSFMVALYMFFTCLAYFRQQQTFLSVITFVVVLDIAVQLVLRRRFRSNSGL